MYGGDDIAGGMFAGVGILIFILALVVYLGVIALALWLGYIIVRNAVKNGILLADEERRRLGHLPQTPPAQLPEQQVRYVSPQAGAASPGAAPEGAVGLPPRAWRER